MIIGRTSKIRTFNSSITMHLTLGHSHREKSSTNVCAVLLTYATLARHNQQQRLTVRIIIDQEASIGTERKRKRIGFDTHCDEMSTALPNKLQWTSVRHKATEEECDKEHLQKSQRRGQQDSSTAA